jgi:hypothetical protein
MFFNKHRWEIDSSSSSCVETIRRSRRVMSKSNSRVTFFNGNPESDLQMRIEILLFLVDTQ